MFRSPRPQRPFTLMPPSLVLCLHLVSTLSTSQLGYYSVSTLGLQPTVLLVLATGSSGHQYKAHPRSQKLTARHALCVRLVAASIRDCPVINAYSGLQVTWGRVCPGVRWGRAFSSEGPGGSARGSMWVPGRSIGVSGTEAGIGTGSC